MRRFPNLNEFFVHHEDVRRANGLGPRTNPPAEDAALFRNVARAPWFLSRRLRGAGLELVWAGTDKVVRARRGQPTARLRGLPGELLLFLFGRRDAADVEISGSPEAVEALQRTSFGYVNRAPGTRPGRRLRAGRRVTEPTVPGQESRGADRATRSPARHCGSVASFCPRVESAERRPASCSYRGASFGGAVQPPSDTAVSRRRARAREVQKPIPMAGRPSDAARVS